MDAIIDTIDMTPVIKALFDEMRDDKAVKIIKALIKEYEIDGSDLVDMEELKANFWENIDMEDVYEEFRDDVLDFVVGKYDVSVVLNEYDKEDIMNYVEEKGWD